MASSSVSPDIKIDLAVQIDTSLDAIDQCVDQLQNLAAQEKQKRLDDLLDKCAKAVDQAEQTAKTALDKAQVMCWRGRIADGRSSSSALTPATSQLSAGLATEAEKLLSKSVKLNPALVSGWNALGNVYWKKKDLVNAENCFNAAIKQKRNPVSLRLLSVVLRNHSGTDGGKETKDAAAAEKKRHQHITESVKVAKEAVGLQMSDGLSWYYLGNAYMARWFSPVRNSDDLSMCLKAYDRAENATTSPQNTNPDLYFNRGNVHAFNEDYDDALRSYRRALELDPALPAQDKIESIQHTVRKLAKLISTRCGIKSKRLEQLLKKTLPSTDKVKAETVEATELSVGDNPKKIIIGTVIAPVSRETDTPISFIMADRAGNMTCLSLYNVSGQVLNFIKVNDVVQIVHPVLKQVTSITPTDQAKSQSERKVAQTEQTEPSKTEADVSYSCVQVRNPVSFLVNGKPLQQSLLALPFYRTDAK